MATSAERAYRLTNRIWDRARSRSAVDAARVEPTGAVGDLRGHRYCVLITYRQDGTPVPTALWFGLRDGRVYVRTGTSTAKLRRIRRSPEVRIAPSTWRARPLGPPFVGRARLLDNAEEPKAEQTIRSNYAWLRRVYLRLLTGHVAAAYVEVEPQFMTRRVH